MKKYLLILFLGALVSFEVAAQSQEAVMNQKGEIVLDESQPLQERYEMNASDFNFTTDLEAMNYFNDLNLKYVAMRPNISNGVINIYLQLKQNPDWTLENWNTYLQEAISPNQGIKLNE